MAHRASDPQNQPILPVTSIHQFRRFLAEHTLLRRCLALLWHVVGIVVSYAIAYGLRFDFNFSDGSAQSFWPTLPIAVSIYVTLIVAFRLHAGLWSYFSYGDCLKYLTTLGLGALVFAVVIYVQRGFSFDQFPRSIPIIHLMVLLVWEISGRMGMRFLRESWGPGRARRRLHRHAGPKRTLLIGDPKEIDAVLNALATSPDHGVVVGVLTTERLHGTLRGAKVLGQMEHLDDVVRETEPDTVIILPPNEKPRQIKRIIDACADAGLKCQYRIVPSVREIAGGQINVSALRDVRIEDLLDRPEVRFDKQLLTDFVTDQQVMVTGAGGSIGSELCRQVLALKPKRLVLFEQSEFALFEIDRELRATYPDADIVAITGDICVEDDIRHALVSTGGIDIIYHAAAYKHVHLMELNTAAAMRNNVLGTDTLANMAAEHGVGHFIMISTDKAVNPTSMMGSSKRLAERALLERPRSKTRFLAVRFGNVLGSSGSVIPIFRKQIEEGGPVTVTTKDTRRYFMTIPEAVQLVMMSGVVGDDRQIMVLEMGKPVKIYNLAKRMIELSGLTPEVDIPIAFIGLRPGEKEYEELLTDDEDVIPTDYQQIAVFAKRQNDLEPLDLQQLRGLIDRFDSDGLRHFCRQAIPEHLLDRSA